MDRPRSQPVESEDGRQLLIREVQPEDEAALKALFRGLSPEDIRMRFFAAKVDVADAAAAQVVGVGRCRDLALVIAEPEAAGQAEVYGSVRLLAGSAGDSAEFDVVVRSDISGQGLGSLLMQRIVADAGGRGFAEIVGEILRQNRPMLAICQQLGFTREPDPNNPKAVIVRLRLPPENA